MLHSSDFTPELDAIGAGEFVTFEDPVVGWGDNTSGVKASFAMSPELLLVVTRRGSALSRTQYAQVVRNHILGAIPFRENLICRSTANGELHAAASKLRPTTPRPKVRT